MKAKDDAPIILKRRKPYSPPKPKLVKEKKRGWKATGRPKGSKNKKTLIKEQNKRFKKIQKNITEKEILITPLFSKIKEVDSLVIALRGGARSSKSYSLAQLMTERFFGCPGRRILILRKTLPSLRVTTLSLMKEYMSLIGMWPFIKESKQTLDWKYGNTLLHFGSLDDPEKIKSSDWNDIWMEEATEFSYRDFMILKTRLSSPICGNLPNQLFMSFNPEDEYCWIKEKVIDADTDCTEIPSSYKDNPFLSDEYRKILEDLEKQDINYWRIYGLGQWGKLTNLVYSNWKIVEDFPIQRSNVIYGLDFGFNNPSALLKLYLDGSECGVEEKIYETGLTTTDLISKMEEAIPLEHRQSHPIYADNAEPDRILEINNAGFWCLPCHKVSVTEGIDDVKQFQIYSLSTNTQYNKEVKTYSWRQDKNDRILDEPVKYNDHYCLVGDTKILMANNTEKKIKDILPEELIQTATGINKVLLSKLTKRKATIYQINLSNGSFLKGTGDHPIYTLDGLVKIKDLNSQKIIVWEELCRSKLYLEKENTIGMEDIILQLVDVLMEEKDYIALNGYSVMEKSQKDMRFIIKIKMEEITEWIIWNLSRLASIDQNILKKNGHQKNLEKEVKNIFWQLILLQKNGMHQKKERNGIDNMQKISGRIECLSQKIVKFVEKNIKHTSLQNQNTAMLIASKKLLEKEDVYNLTVENDHNYYANKILVKNCDAMRYALSTYVRQNLMGRPRIREL